MSAIQEKGEGDSRNVTRPHALEGKLAQTEQLPRMVYHRINEEEPSRRPGLIGKRKKNVKGWENIIKAGFQNVCTTEGMRGLGRKKLKDILNRVSKILVPSLGRTYVWHKGEGHG